jgi:peptidoglycan/xylan/chitin deacetylase (PgdA/CDA1 family)
LNTDPPFRACFGRGITLRAVALAVPLAVLLLGLAPAAVADVPAVTLTAPTEGSLLTGSVDMAAATTGTVATVEFDWSSDGGSSWAPIATDGDGSDGWTAVWASGAFSGPAMVRATAISGGDGSAQATASVTVDNQAPAAAIAVGPDPFSPNGDGRKDTATIGIAAGEPASIGAVIKNGSGTVLVTWGPQFSTTGTRSIVWNGKAGSAVLPDGLYTVQATATDRVQLSASSARTVRIDTTRPSFYWRFISPEPVSTQSTMSYAFHAWDRAPSLSITLSVYDRLGKVGARTATVARGDAGITWSPRYSSGAYLFPGRYRGRIRVMDDAGNVAWSSYKPWREHRAVNASVWRRVDGAGSRVALTFDDCYNTGAWERILDILKARGVHATFFCNGVYVAARPDLARRTSAEGHGIGSHTYDHVWLTQVSYSTMVSEMRADQTAWWNAARETPAPFFRPPYGAYNSTVVYAAGQTSYARVILWDVDPTDYATTSSSTIAYRVLHNVRAGSIVVMHALWQTAGALPAILDGLKSRGLLPVTLPQLFRAAGYR